MEELRAKLLIESHSQASTQRTEPYVSTPNAAGVEGAKGICRCARGRWRGLSGLRGDAPNHTSVDQAPPVWRAPEGPEGTGGLRERPLRAFRLACGDLAGGRARRRPEHQRSRKQQAQSLIPAAPPVWRVPEGPEGTGKPRTATSPARLEAAARPAGPGRASRRRAERSSRRGRRAGGQATRRPEIWRGHKHRRTEKPQNSSWYSGFWWAWRPSGRPSALIAAICSEDSENEKMSRFSRWRSGLPDLGRGRAPSW